MPKYLIERELPGAGSLSQEQLAEIANASCGVVRDLQSDYHWVHSYVTGDKIFCVHVAPSEEVVREHARRGGFPITSVMEIKNTIDATTGERAPAAA